MSNALNLMDAKRSCMVKTLNIMDANINGFTVSKNYYCLFPDLNAGHVDYLLSHTVYTNAIFYWTIFSRIFYDAVVNRCFFKIIKYIFLNQLS